MRSRLLTRSLLVGALGLALALMWSLSVPQTETTEAAPQINLTLTPVASSLSSPVGFVAPGDGSGRMFIIEKGGYIRILEGGAVLGTAFLDIHTLVSTGTEEGLLGLAFHPNYDGATNRFFYIFYTNTSGNLVIERRQSVAGNPRLADTNPATILNILTIPHPTNSNHNGGTVLFGPDGYLYISVGDGGGGGDPNNNAQNLNTLLGKILRINVDSPSGGNNYGIPPGNPYLETPMDDPATRAEIWHYGLRNPWRFSFDRQTNEMFIGDVGQGAREEIDYAPAGASGINYGWRACEGTIQYPPAPTPVPCTNPGFTNPLTDYPRTLGTSITGGFRYRGSANPNLQGVYLFGDFGSGRIWGLTANGGSWSRVEYLDTTLNISSFGEDEAGEVYVVHYGGTIYRVVDTDSTTPGTATRTPTRTSTPTITLTPTITNGNADTPGVYRPSGGGMFLRNTNSSGAADIVFAYGGVAGDRPLAGNWDGDSDTSVGVFRSGTFYLRNTNSNGPADLVFAYGLASDTPIVGDWDGDGTDTVGVYRNGVFYLRNSNTSGPADLVFGFGVNGDTPVVGDWNGDGVDTVGVFRTGTFFLRNSNSSGPADLVFGFGLASDIPLAGDWDADGDATIGVFRNGVFYLRNTNSSGAVDTVLAFGLGSDRPIVGDWDGLP